MLHEFRGSNLVCAVRYMAFYIGYVVYAVHMIAAMFGIISMMCTYMCMHDRDTHRLHF
jgi:hypothetical protein